MGARTDGTEFVHNDPRKKKKTHYDAVWDLLERASVKMMGDHEQFGGNFEIVDANSMKVGTVTFDKDNTFKGGTLYGEHFVDGRTNGKHEAFYRFTGMIGDLYDV